MSDRLRHLDLTAAGEPYRTAHAGNGWKGDGITSYIRSTNFPLFSAAQPWTTFFSYVSTDNFSNPSPAISSVLVSGTLGNGITIDPSLVMFFNNTTIATGPNTGPSTYIIQNNLLFAPVVKKQVLITYDGAQNFTGTEFYLNGRKTGTYSWGKTTSPAIANPCQPAGNTMYIAIRPEPSSGQQLANKYNQTVRQTQLINRVMTAEEIRETFNKGTMIDIAANNEFLIAMDFDKVSGNPTNLVPITGSDSNELAWTNVGSPVYQSFF